MEGCLEDVMKGERGKKVRILTDDELQRVRMKVRM